MRYAAFALLLVFAALSAVHAFEYSPQSAGITGRTLVTITGNGFSRFSTVSCVWGDSQWYSPEAHIVDDRTMVCRTPFITDMLSVVPFQTALSVLFDGELSEQVSIDSTFTFGPVFDSVSPLTPSSGFTAGGTKITLRGANFDALGGVQRVLVGEFGECDQPAVLRDGAELTCIVPAGEFNHDAKITVEFGNGADGRTWRVHVPNTHFHYGPLFTSVSPSCTALTGGTVVTITGINLDDPLLANGQELLQVEMIMNGNRTTTTTVAFNANTLALTFVAPIIDRGRTNTADQIAEIDVIFTPLRSRVPVFSSGRRATLHYGPVLWTPDFPGPYTSAFLESVTSAASAHAGGGDQAVMYGCGLSQFGVAQLSPLVVIDGAETELCFRSASRGSALDSLTVIAGATLDLDRVQCITAELPCTASNVTSQSRDVSLRVFTRLPLPFNASYLLPIVGTAPQYTSCPLISGSAPLFGAYNGGDTITISGSSFFFSALSRVWSAKVTFASDAASITRVANIASDTLITVVTPIGFKWDTTTTLTVDFVDRLGTVVAGHLPREGAPLTLSFTFRPTCQLIDSAGPVSGGNTVNVAGVALDHGRAAVARTSTVVRVCLHRLNPTVESDGACSVYEPVASGITIDQAQLAFRMPSARQNVLTPQGLNREFGDLATVQLLFSEVPTQALDGITEAVLTCGTYRFGAQLNGAVQPPLGAVLTSAQPFSINGTFLRDDAAYGTAASSSAVWVAIGTKLQRDAALVYTDAGAAVGVSARTASITDAPGIAGSCESVSAVLTPCNHTVSSVRVHWGPRVSGVAGPLDAAAPRNDSLHGLLPSGGDVLTVYGYVFNDAAFGGVWCRFSNGFVTPATNIALGSGTAGETTLQCVTPASEFGSHLTLTLEFDDASRKFAVAPTVLWYAPRLDTFGPQRGDTSGATLVTFTGAALHAERFGAAYCYFGHYTNGVAAVISGDGTSLQCRTPTQRGEFNTDVPVHVRFGGVAGEGTPRWQVYPGTDALFHYGPACFDVTPTTGSVLGGYNVTLSGTGLQDCLDSNTTLISNCSMRHFKVWLRVGNTLVSNGGFIYDSLAARNTYSSYEVAAPRATQCQQRPRFVLEYVDAVVSDHERRFVTCSAPSSRDYFFHYGPLVTGVTSLRHRHGTSYGWTGDLVNITGTNLRDPGVLASGNGVSCAFGAAPGVVVSHTNTSLVCAAPAGVWDALVNVSITLRGGAFECAAGVQTGDSELRGGDFHYGPVLDSLAPSHGYVAGGNIVTLSGFAFDCCNIDSVRCLWPDRNEPVALNVSATALTCRVPLNVQIDRLALFVGARFSSAAFPASPETALTVTEARTVPSYFYGPRVNDVSPTQLRLSALGQSVTIRGRGFSDPYLGNVTYCDFVPLRGAATLSVTASSASDSEIVCKVPEYAHACGAIDQVRPRWLRNCSPPLCTLRTELGTTYYTTQQLVSASAEQAQRAPYYTDGGSDTPQVFAVQYGPVVTGVTGQLMGPVSGGNTVTVSGDSFADWIGTGSTHDFGSETALCVFGDRIASAPAAIDGSTNTIVCTVPPGEFGEEQLVSVLLDPKIVKTTSDNTWSWLPKISGVSRNWAPANVASTAQQPQQVLVYGVGFSAFTTCECVWGDVKNGNGVTQVPGSVIDDETLLCTVPEYVAGVVPLSVVLGDSLLSSDSECDSVRSTPPLLVLESFTFVGAASVSPQRLPACTASSVIVSGVGFSRFDAFECRIGGVRVAGEYVSDTSVRCYSPPQNLVANKDEPELSLVSCHAIVVVGKRDHRPDVLMPAAVQLAYGLPEVLSVFPTSADVEDSVDVYVQGQFFEGLPPNGTYRCRFGEINVPGELTYRRTSAASEAVVPTIRCPTPTLRDHPTLAVGTVLLEVRADCAKGTFTNNRMQFTFTQDVLLNGIAPSKGFEVGGTAVTVFGQNLTGGSAYFCSFGPVPDANADPTQPQNQLVSAKLLLDGVPESRFNPVVVCVAPARKDNTTTTVDFALSLDGGASFTRSPFGFRYLNVVKVCPREPAASVSAASTVAGARSIESMLLVLCAAVLALMFAETL